MINRLVRDSLLRTLDELNRGLDVTQQLYRLDQAVGVAYKHRVESDEWREFCECAAWIAFRQCTETPPVLVRQPRWGIAIFARLAQLLVEKGQFDLAAHVCTKAAEWGLSDNTKTGYAGRAQRILRAAQASVVQKGEPRDFDECLGVLQSFAAFLETAPTFEGIRSVVPENYTGTVPSFPGPGLRTLSQEQLAFYEKWVTAWKQGEYIELEEQANYAFKYVFETVLNGTPKNAIPDLMRLQHTVKGKSYWTKSLIYRCGRWISDFYVIQGDYRRALESVKLPLDHHFSLKLLAQDHLTAFDIRNYFGQQSVTEFGRKHWRQLDPLINHRLREYEAIQGETILEKWAKQSRRMGYRIFLDTREYYYFRELNLPFYIFYEDPAIGDYRELFADISRQAENEYRLSIGMPRISEGWIAETELYYAIRDAFPQLDVEHQASPEWLGQQHLDIFIPELKVAIEYQGPQHDKPIDFFGGQAAFEETQKRDRRKKECCDRNGIALLYVRPDYVLDSVLATIRASARAHDK